MRRRIIIALAVALAIALFSTVAQAGVEGKFVFDFYVTPQTTTAQASLIDVNFEGLLYLNLSLSGLNMTTFSAFGAAGLETIILGFNTLLGPLAINDQFWFSVPYGGPTNCPQVCQVQQGKEYCWLACDPRLDDELYFVKKRVQLDLSIGGITLGALILWEDVNFTYPYPLPVKPQDFRFGVCVSVTGTTVSGIKITSSTGLYCDPSSKNTVKKYSAYGRVVADQWGEVIKISGIQIGGLTFSSSTTFKPNMPISEKLTVSWALMGFTIKADLNLEDVTKLKFTRTMITFALSDNIAVTITDLGGDFVIDDVTIDLTDIAIQTAVINGSLSFTPGGAGISALSFGLELPIPIGTFSGTLTYGGAPLKWKTFDFALAADVAGLGLTLTTTFGITGLDNFHVILTIPFSA